MAFPVRVSFAALIALIMAAARPTAAKTVDVSTLVGSTIDANDKIINDASGVRLIEFTKSVTIAPASGDKHAAVVGEGIVVDKSIPASMTLTLRRLHITPEMLTSAYGGNAYMAVSVVGFGRVLGEIVVDDCVIDASNVDQTKLSRQKQATLIYPGFGVNALTIKKSRFVTPDDNTNYWAHDFFTMGTANNRVTVTDTELGYGASHGAADGSALTFTRVTGMLDRANETIKVYAYKAKAGATGKYSVIFQDCALSTTTHDNSILSVAAQQAPAAVGVVTFSNVTATCSGDCVKGHEYGVNPMPPLELTLAKTTLSSGGTAAVNVRALNALTMTESTLTMTGARAAAGVKAAETSGSIAVSDSVVALTAPQQVGFDFGALNDAATLKFTDVTVNAGPGVAHKYSGDYSGATVCDHGEAADVRAACTGDWSRATPAPVVPEPVTTAPVLPEPTGSSSASAHDSPGSESESGPSPAQSDSVMLSTAASVLACLVFSVL